MVRLLHLRDAGHRFCRLVFSARKSCDGIVDDPPDFRCGLCSEAVWSACLWKDWRSGRTKYAFLITLTVMGISTALVGILPTFAAIGWAAPIILFLLRVTQGLALGGEWGGAATYVA